MARNRGRNSGKRRRARPGEKSLANLRPWPRGRSGNPGGRPLRVDLVVGLELLGTMVPRDPLGRTLMQVMRECVAVRLDAVRSVRETVQLARLAKDARAAERFVAQVLRGMRLAT